MPSFVIVMAIVLLATLHVCYGIYKRQTDAERKASSWLSIVFLFDAAVGFLCGIVLIPPYPLVGIPVAVVTLFIIVELLRRRNHAAAGAGSL